MKTVVKTVLAIWLSALVALPAPLWAKDGSPDSQPADAKDGVPLIFEELRTPDGGIAYIATAAIPHDLELQVVGELAQVKPGELIVGVNGATDPVFKLLQSTPTYPDIEVYDHSQPFNGEALGTNRFGASWRNRISAKIQQITEFARTKRAKVGLMTSVWVSSISAGYTMYETSSVVPGVSTFMALMSWTGFQGVSTVYWQRYLQGGGNLFRSAFSALYNLVGKKMDPRAERVYDVAGEFAATWAANSLVVGFVFWMAGTLDHAWKVPFYGFLGSYDILDSAAEERDKQGKLTTLLLRNENFVLARLLAGPVLELSTWLNIPYTTFGLASLTVAALTYRALHHKIDEHVKPKIVTFHMGVVNHCSVILKKRKGGNQ